MAHLRPGGHAWGTRVYFWQRVNGADGIQSNEAAFDHVVCVLSANLGDTVGWMGSRAYTTGLERQVRWAHIG